MRTFLVAAAFVLVAAPLSYAQNYRVPLQNSPVDNLNTAPSIMRDDGSINTDPAMTSSTTENKTSRSTGRKATNCLAGSATSVQPDNTDTPQAPSRADSSLSSGEALING